MVLMSKMLKLFIFVLVGAMAGGSFVSAQTIENLPADAANLTSGIYIDSVTQDSRDKVHDGDIGVSGTADVNILSSNTDPSVTGDYSYTLNGNLTVGTTEETTAAGNGTVIVTNQTSENFEFKMGGDISVLNGGQLSVDNSKSGTMTVSGVSQLDVRGNNSIADFGQLTIDELDSINVDNFGKLNLSDTEVKGGDKLSVINVMNSAKMTLDNAKITGSKYNLNVIDNGMLEMKNGSSVAVGSEGAIVFSYGNLEMDNSSLTAEKENAGETPKEFTFVQSAVSLKNGSNLTKHSGGDLIFDRGSIVLGDSSTDTSSIVHDGASGNINLNSTGSVNLRGEASIVRNTGDNGNIYIVGTDVAMADKSKVEVATNNGDIFVRGSNVVMSGEALLNANATDKNEITLSNNSWLTLRDSAKVNTQNFNINGSLIDMSGSSSVNAALMSVVGNSRIDMTENSTINSDVLLRDTAFLSMTNGSKINGNLTAQGYSGNYPVLVVGMPGNNEELHINGKLDFNFASINISDGSKLVIDGTGHSATMGDDTFLWLGTGKLDLGGNNMKLGSSSVLGLRIASKSDYGQVLNGGTITIDSGAGLDVSIDKSVVGKGHTEEFQILSGTVTGDWVNFNRRYEFNHLGGGKYAVTQVADAGDIVIMDGGTENNANTANAWLEGNNFANGSEAAKVYDELDYLSQYGQGSEYIDALTVLAPDAAPLVRSLTMENSNQIFNAVQNRLEGGSSLRMKPGRAGRYARGLASGDMYREDAIWVQGLYNHSELSDTKESKGFEIDSYGGAIGLDNYVTDSLKLGIGYAYTQGDISGFLRDTDVDTHTGFVYGEFKPNRWFLNAIASYSFANYDEEKRVASFKVKGDYDVNAFGAQVMTGYKLGYVTPELGVRYLNVRQDAYEDSIGQRVDAVSNDVLTGVFGIRIKQDFFPNRGFSIRPEVHVAATYDFVQDDAVSVVSLPNGSVYQIEGENLDKFGLEAGAGLTLDVGNRLEMAVSYEGKFRKDYTDHSGLVNMKFKF